MVVGAILDPAEYLDAGNPIVRHRVVLDVDLEGILVCPAEAPLDEDANEGVVGDDVSSEGGVAEDVAITLGEHIDPDKPILPDLVVGDGGVSDLSAGPRSRHHDPERRMLHLQARDGVVAGNNTDTSSEHKGRECLALQGDIGDAIASEVAVDTGLSPTERRQRGVDRDGAASRKGNCI